MDLFKEILSVWIPGFLFVLYIPLSLVLFAYRKDRNVLQNDIKNIKENLDNHVTDTDKKIDKLDIKIDKLDTKIGNIDTKLDTKFDRLNSRLDKVFDSPQRTDVSSERNNK